MYEAKIESYNRYRLAPSRHGNPNLVTLSGMDMPDSEVVQETRKVVVLKAPGHKYWSQLPPGPTHSYAPAEFQVFIKVEDGWLIKVAEFPVMAKGIDRR